METNQNQNGQPIVIQNVQQPVVMQNGQQMVIQNGQPMMAQSVQQPIVMQNGQQMLVQNGQQPMFLQNGQPMIVQNGQQMMIQNGQQPVVIQNGQQTMVQNGQQVVMQPMVVQNAPVVTAPEYSPRLRTIKRLAITQTVIGTAMFLIGMIMLFLIVSTYGVVVASNSPMWFGAWIIMTGILGICSSRRNEPCVKGFYLAGTIISTIGSFVLGLMYFIYMVGSWRPALEFTIPLLLLMIAEFFISIAAAVSSCEGCCRRSPQTNSGVIVQTTQPITMVTSSAPPPDHHNAAGTAMTNPPPPQLNYTGAQQPTAYTQTQYGAGAQPSLSYTEKPR